MENYMKRLRDLREDNDLTQSQVAEYLGTSQTMYARYERGANELPIRHLISLCKLYSVSADEILGLSDPRESKNKRRHSGS
ncbi:MAG TPA: helix-turn-helix domain-containing protein [Firmicutes bacterium]|nr:helix-turn-helix domain-containing protein [Bacillota bacterium]